MDELRESGLLRQAAFSGIETRWRGAADLAKQKNLNVMETLSEAGLQGSEALAKASTHTYAQSFQQALKNGATFDQALKQATADTAMETITWRVPLKDLLDDIKGDPKKARTEIDKALKRDGIHMTPVELQWLGAVAAEASFLQYDSNFYRKIALEMMTGMDYETAHAVASRTAWQEAAREMSVIEVTSSQREGMGADNGRQGNRMASTSENPVEAVDTEVIPKYDRENGQEALDNGLDGTQQTDEGDVCNGVSNSLDKSSQSGTIIQDAIDSGQVSAKINREKQLRHTKDNHGLGKSYLYGDLDYAQELVDKYSGTGDAISTKGKWTHRERIIADNNIGIYVDSDGNETESNQAIIVYSRTGTHIYPARKENLDET